MHNKALNIFVMFNVFLLVQKSGAFEFTVGGSKGWTIPSDPNTPIYNQWAEATRFQVGDSICKCNTNTFLELLVVYWILTPVILCSSFF